MRRACVSNWTDGRTDVHAAFGSTALLRNRAMKTIGAKLCKQSRHELQGAFISGALPEKHRNGPTMRLRVLKSKMF